MSRLQRGNIAEQAVCDYLRSKEFKIIARNWKTRTCEIDIIALKSECIYFVEVKSRADLGCGNGFEYVTVNKLRQMAYAARLWSAKHHYSGARSLSAASVSGSEMRVEFIEQI